MRFVKLSAAGSLICLAVAVGAVATPTEAAPASKTAGCKSASHRSTNPARYVDNFITGLRRGGASQAEVERALARSLCIVRIDTGPAGSPTVAGRTATSTNSAVTVTAPTISWDNQALKYYAISYWKWTKNTWTDEMTWLANTTKSIGGDDGFGTAFNVPMLLSGYSATAYGDPSFGTWSISPAADANAYGAAYAFQDKGHCRPYISGTMTLCRNDLNVREGQEVISFRKSGTCKTVYGFGKYTHTWSSTKVTGGGIGKMSVSFSTTSTTHRWSSQSQPGNTATVCSSAT